VSKFCQGLCHKVDDAISKDIGLVLDDPMLWYNKAKNHELIAKFTKAYHDSQTPTSTQSTYPA
jgi:hypothetical protein